MIENVSAIAFLLQNFKYPAHDFWEPRIMCKKANNIFAAIFGLAVISATSHASATGSFISTCADLDASQNGVSYNRTTGDDAHINAVAGDIL